MPRPNPIRALQQVTRILYTQRARLERMCDTLELDITRNSLLTGEDLRSYKKATTYAKRMLSHIDKALAYEGFEGVQDVALRKSRGRPSNADYAEAASSRKGTRTVKRKAVKTVTKKRARRK